jgi:RNA polymerase sigma-70 factor (ECF subfamily)
MPAVAKEGPGEPLGLPHAAIFPTTHWSVVLSAQGSSNPATHEALARLCEIYRPAVLAFTRSLGLPPADAEDLTQDFFTHLLKKEVMSHFEPHDRVKFRSFLLRCLRHFLSNQRQRQQALKRGGGAKVDSLDALSDTGQPSWEPATEANAATLYEREWATALLNQVLDRLEGEYAARGRHHLFNRLQDLLLDRKGDRPYAQLAEDLGMTEDAVKKEVSRMRQRYRELLHEEVASTVLDPTEMEEEIAHLFSVMSR